MVVETLRPTTPPPGAVSPPIQSETTGHGQPQRINDKVLDRSPGLRPTPRHTGSPVARSPTREQLPNNPLTPGGLFAHRDSLPSRTGGSASPRSSVGDSPQPSPLCTGKRSGSRAAWPKSLGRGVSFTLGQAKLSHSIGTSDYSHSLPLGLTHLQLINHSNRLVTCPSALNVEDKPDEFLDPIFDPDVGLVPQGWHEIVSQTGGTLCNSLRSISFIAHILWSGIPCSAVGCGIAAFKVYVYHNADGERDTKREWLGILDASLAVAAALLYLVYFTWELPYPSERSSVTHGVAVLLWGIVTIVNLFIRDAESVTSAVVYACACAAATIAVGVCGAWRLQTRSFLATHSLPLLLLGLVAGGVVGVVQQLKGASDSALLTARILLGLAPFIPLGVLHIGLRFRHRFGFPRQIRATFGGYRLAFSFVCKLLSFSLPLVWCIAGEACHHTLRFLLRASAPQQWQLVERAITGHWPTPEMTSWQQVRLHASQGLIVGFQSDVAAIHAAGWVIFWLRHFNGDSTSSGTLVLSGTLQLAVALLEAIVSTTLLHMKKFPVSGVYWLFSKQEHFNLMVSTACVVMFATLRPELLHVLEDLDK
eukprot:Hpha_TRINITY_DN34300_c0_g1::TRINITY_DN34300_c0_g1_i1::g.109573::m.109573